MTGLIGSLHTGWDPAAHALSDGFDAVLSSGEVHVPLTRASVGTAERLRSGSMVCLRDRHEFRGECREELRPAPEVEQDGPEGVASLRVAESYGGVESCGGSLRAVRPRVHDPPYALREGTEAVR